MKYLYFTILCLSFSASQADQSQVYQKEFIISSSSELNEWCQNESSRYFLAKDITPYNWTASWWSEGNNLLVKGTWLANREKVEIKCSIRSGAPERYANMQVNSSAAKAPTSKKTITIKSGKPK